MQGIKHPKQIETLRFPSVEDIKASLGGTITRCGNRVLWSPNRISSFKIEPSLTGKFRLRPFWQHPHEDNPFRLEKVPNWASKCKWYYRNSVIAEEFKVSKSLVAYWRRKLGKE